MRILLIALFALFALLIASAASARDYGSYDPKRLLTVSETPSGKKYGVDVAYLDQMLNDLSSHAKNYPAQFDTPQDQRRATHDVKTLSGMLDILIDAPTPNPELLVRAGYLNSLGHNLDIAGAAEKADSIFQRLLAGTPSDPRGNFMYGTFLAGVGKSKEALPYLEKALSVGVIDAAYAIGMAYMMLGDKEQALRNLEEYKRRKPADDHVDKVIDAIRQGNVEFKRHPG
jgi:tetratricopeptide (TPR) repeat protein